MPEMPEILSKAVAMRATDILFVPDEPPIIRIDSRLQKLEGFAPLPAAETKRLIYSVLTQRQIQLFEKSGELDMPLHLPGITRFRVNVFLQRKGIACALRPLAQKIPAPTDIGLEPVVVQMAEMPRGLILVAGPAGSGKTTTLATLIEHLNVNHQKHIITIEDPIEFVYENQGCIIDQREVGTHTATFAGALRSALRENPDVIMVGEMRDLETIELAIRAAETGHLCVSTLHTKDAASTIDRIVNEFPSEQQPKIKLALSSVLVGVVSQVLVPKIGGGRVCAREVMLMNSSISSLIRDNKVHQIPGTIQAAKAEGMCTLDQSLADLVMKKVVSREIAREFAQDLNSFANIFNQLAIPEAAEVLK
jgi:twitching motility protein PilT